MRKDEGTKREPRQDQGRHYLYIQQLYTAAAVAWLLIAASTGGTIVDRTIPAPPGAAGQRTRSEEHTSELSH
jgi:hypothetical protein